MAESTAITIIIPTRNEEEMIESTLDRLQQMRKRGNQLILVDGGSSDKTVSRASPLVDRLLTASPGRANQLRTGLAEALHPVIWFLHADTLAAQDADLAILKALAAPDRHWGRFDIRLDGTKPIYRVIEGFMNWRSCLTGICTGDQGIFMHRETLEQAGGLPDQPLMEDIELSKRLKKASRPVCLEQQLVTSSRRWESRGILRTVLTMWYLRAAYALGTDAATLARLYR